MPAALEVAIGLMARHPTWPAAAELQWPAQGPDFWRWPVSRGSWPLPAAPHSRCLPAQTLHFSAKGSYAGQKAHFRTTSAN